MVKIIEISNAVIEDEVDFLSKGEVVDEDEMNENVLVLRQKSIADGVIEEVDDHKDVVEDVLLQNKVELLNPVAQSAMTCN